MVSRGFTVFLGFLRIAAGLSLLLSGLRKLQWFMHPEVLQQRFTEWAAHPASPLVGKYLGWVSQHHGVFARLVVLGELGLGALLVVGLLTPLVALLAFLMVANFQFASGAMFSLQYLQGQSGLVYLLSFPVLMLGRGGTFLGLDGIISRSGRKPPAP